MSESKWFELEPKLENHVVAIMKIDGVPLSYVMHINDLLDYVGPHTDFNEETIVCTPLSGVAFEAYRGTVHQCLLSFTTV